MSSVNRKSIICVSIAALLAAGQTGLAADERTPLKEKFPKAGEVIPLVEGFPLLKNLLELARSRGLPRKIRQLTKQLIHLAV